MKKALEMIVRWTVEGMAMVRTMWSEGCKLRMAGWVVSTLRGERTTYVKSEREEREEVGAPTL